MTNIESFTSVLLASVLTCREQNGYNFALGLSGTPSDIQAAFDTMSNAGVTCGELLDLGSPNFAYVWTAPEKFANCLASWELGRELSAFEDTERAKVGGRKYRAHITARFEAERGAALRAKWAAVFEALPRESFVPYDTGFVPEVWAFSPQESEVTA